ncbi:uncharacterized protein BJ212DRAFT_1300436 [Suillus subaureus]|uniref:Uncharacterized protein n=1 Tax=Suillus subaureus TaxID=48587 RepID=A0A9P7JC70_9AGAM|nr:uncharacterized protein BJ212DRAFT_1300436 [Suillus subaureus]KAG1814625.1 hypothetical protein BJ212DRAFT_1300436 [Suillus subaureus]
MPCSTRIMDSAINGHILMQCTNEHCGFRAILDPTSLSGLIFSNSMVWLVLPQQTRNHLFNWSISVALYLLKGLLLLLEDQQVIMDADACPPVSWLDKTRMVWL